jgi:aminocarboxymuconate-semialdehyde decarboxylase
LLIDTHTHVLPPDHRDTVRFPVTEVFFDAERRLEAQHATGVDAEVLTPMPPLLRYDLPAAEGLSLARQVNEFIAAMCSADPARLMGFGMVPLQDPDIAAAELTEIQDLGLLGVEIASGVLGASIGDERFLPFFAEATRLGLAVFVHAMPTPTDRLPTSTMGTYVVGIEGAFAAASLVTGGTAAKCPDLRISFSHGAGGFPLMLPRAQYFWGGTWNEEPPVPEKAIAPEDGPSPLEYARRFYYDTTVFDRRALRYLVELLGPDRLLVGSDFPAMPREEPCARTLRSLDLPDAALADVTWFNAFRWLGTEPPW